MAVLRAEPEHRLVDADVDREAELRTTTTAELSELIQLCGRREALPRAGAEAARGRGYYAPGMRSGALILL